MCGSFVVLHYIIFFNYMTIIFTYIKPFAGRFYVTFKRNRFKGKFCEYKLMPALFNTKLSSFESCLADNRHLVNICWVKETLIDICWMLWVTYQKLHNLKILQAFHFQGSQLSVLVEKSWITCFKLIYLSYITSQIIKAQSWLSQSINEVIEY